MHRHRRLSIPAWQNEITAAVPDDGTVPTAVSNSEMAGVAAAFGASALFTIVSACDDPPRLQTVVGAVVSAAKSGQVTSVCMGLEIMVPPVPDGAPAAVFATALPWCKVMVTTPDGRVAIPAETIVSGQFTVDECSGVAATGPAVAATAKAVAERVPSSAAAAVVSATPAHVLEAAGHRAAAAAVAYYGDRVDLYRRDVTAGALRNGDALLAAVTAAAGSMVTAETVDGWVANGLALCGVLDRDDVAVIVAAVSAAVATTLGVPVVPTAALIDCKPLRAKPVLPAHLKAVLFPRRPTVGAAVTAVIHAPPYNLEGVCAVGVLATLVVEPWRSPFGLGSGSHTMQTVSEALRSAGVPGPAMWTWATTRVIVESMASPPRHAVNEPVIIVVVISGAANVTVVAVHAVRNGVHRKNQPWALSRSTVAVVAVGTADAPVEATVIDNAVSVNGKPVQPGCLAVL